jgi:hypothetical protein
MVLCTSNVIQTKTDLSSCLRHPFGYVLFYALKLPNGFQSVDRQLLIAICHFIWLLAANMELSGTTQQVPSFSI